jgi:hypothetical protein
LGDDASFTPHGKRVVTASWHNIVGIFGADSGTEIGAAQRAYRFGAERGFRRRRGGIFRIRISSMFSITATNLHLRRSVLHDANIGAQRGCRAVIRHCHVALAVGVEIGAPVLG